MTAILWQRRDGIGLDRATIEADAAGHRIAGTALLEYGGNSYDIRYSVLVDAGWRTRVAAAHLQGPEGERRLSLRVDEAGRWKTGEQDLEELAGATDVDFGFTPATNTLPINRLALGIGEAADVAAGRVAFPERSIEVVTQRYERLNDTTYRYSSADFVADLIVDDNGLVTTYPGRWEAVR
jgi:hypothetical protein